MVRRNTHMIDEGVLAQVDLVDVGARSGMLWRSDTISIAGVGEPELLPIERSARGADVREVLMVRSGEQPDVPGVGSVGLTALPFDPSRNGTLVIPPVTLVECDGDRFVTVEPTWSIDGVEAQVKALLDAVPSPPPTEIRLELHRRADEWRDDVIRAARDHLRRSTLEKAVLARLLTLHANAPFAVDSIVRDLARRFPHAQLFAIDGFIGASPELLVSRSSRVVRAHPLAGTALRDEDPSVDNRLKAELLTSRKDRTEHRITIDWLLAELLPFCSYVDAEPDPSIMTLANVHHLGTLVEGLLSEPAASILDLVAAVHPTPAVGGNPQAAAMSLIAEIEGFDRARYAGPAGWVDAAGNGEFAVSVRTAEVHGATARIAAGVGVVEQSDPEAELIETQAKFTAMLGTFLGAR